DRARPVQVVPGSGELVAGERQLDERRALVGPERVGLVRPVEVSGSEGEAVEVVGAALVIAPHGVEPGLDHRGRRATPFRGGATPRAAPRRAWNGASRRGSVAA